MTIAYSGHGNGELEIHCIERSLGEKAMAASQFSYPCRDCLAAMEDAKGWREHEHLHVLLVHS